MAGPQGTRGRRALTTYAELVEVKGERFLIRAMAEGDRAYVATTWGASYFNRSGVTREVYRLCHARVIDRCLDTGRTLVVCIPESPSSLLGFACGEAKILHYVYLAFELRGDKLASKLIERVSDLAPRERGLCTHRFRDRRRPNLRFTFNPYIAGYYE